MNILISRKRAQKPQEERRELSDVYKEMSLTTKHTNYTKWGELGD